MMNTPALHPHLRLLGQILITKGILSEDQLRIALLEQMKSNQPIGKLLVALGFVSEATLRDALSESLGKQSIDLSNAIIDPSALKVVPRDLAKRHHLLPLDYDAANHVLTVAIADINDIVALDRIRVSLARTSRSTRCSPARRKSIVPSTSATVMNCRSTASCTKSKPARSTSAACNRPRRVQPAGRPPDRLDPDRCRQARFFRHPLRAGSELPAHPLPHRRHAAADSLAAQDLLAGDGGAHQGALAA
jgi:hypothetical protein